MLAMEGEFYEVDVNTLAVRQLFNLVKELDIRGRCISRQHLRRTGEVVVANNSYYRADYLGKESSGRLAGMGW